MVGQEILLRHARWHAAYQASYQAFKPIFGPCNDWMQMPSLLAAAAAAAGTVQLCES